MRNIVEYPITIEEITGCLERLRKQALEEIKDRVICGDMTPLLLDRAIQMVILYAEAEKTKSAAD